MAAKDDIHEAVRETNAMQTRFEVLTDATRPKLEEAVQSETNAMQAAADEQITCGHCCSQHHEVMNPNLWSSLTKELLHLVFARLPVGGILRLRCLCKQWKRNVETGGSEFLRVCEEAYPRLFGHISSAGRNEDFWVRVFDVGRDKWSAFKICVGREGLEMMNACDGGLVCFLGWKKASSLSITVMNPLTQEWRELPPSQDPSLIEPSMVQIVVDRQSRHYKVVVVRNKEKTKPVEVYHSATQQWTKGDQHCSDRIVGCEYEWGQDAVDNYYPYRVSLCGYNFEERRALKYSDKSSWRKPNAKNYALLKDRVFVLHKDSVKLKDRPEVVIPFYCITEYQMRRGGIWQSVKMHRGGPFEDPPRGKHFMRLYACKPGFLIVVYHSFERLPYRQEPGWLYDLATEKWRDLPKLPGGEVCVRDQTGGSLCELHWDVQP